MHKINKKGFKEAVFTKEGNKIDITHQFFSDFGEPTKKKV